MALLNSAQSYTFSKYFELRFESGELAEELGYTLRRQQLQLPQTTKELPFIADLQQGFREYCPMLL